MQILLALLVSFACLSSRQCGAFAFSQHQYVSRCAHGCGIKLGTLSSLHAHHDEDENNTQPSPKSSGPGDLEKLKQEEARLATLLASVRQQKLAVLRSRPLNIGVIGFGRFGQFISQSFTKYGNVIGTSRTNYTQIANEIGVTYIPLSNLESFVVDEDLDVIVLATSIVSFEDTVKDLVPHLQKRMEKKGNDSCPLIVDVASVKEHPREILLKHLPEECDILSTHPMFGPDSAKHGWQGQAFVYEKTRINKILIECKSEDGKRESFDGQEMEGTRCYNGKAVFDVESERYVEGLDRMERFLR